MSNERRQILQMLSEGKIDTDEAERLLDALNRGDQPQAAAVQPSGKPKWLRVEVKCDPDEHNGRENVNVKVPLSLLRAGVKLGSLMPEKARAKMTAHMGSHGIDLGDLDADKLDGFIGALCECPIEVDSEKDKVRIYCC